MATTEVTLNGNGTTGPYSYSGIFEAIKQEDIKVSVNNIVKTYTTDYTVNFVAGTITFVSLTPSSSDSIRIYRVTDADEPAAIFSPGSALRAQDLNDNFLQTLYVSQEVVRDVGGAAVDVNTAVQAAAAAELSASNAETAANTATSTANTANTTANTALSTANTANTTANTALSTAQSAVTTANNADTKADSAIAAVAAAVLYEPVNNVASIPGSPSNNDAVEVVDSTGIESFTPLANIPAGFVGDSGLSVRIIYSTALSTWEWIQYFANDSDDRYAGVNTNAGTLAAPSIAFGPSDTNTGIYSPGADQLSLVTGGTARLTVDAAGAVNVPGTFTIAGQAVMTSGTSGAITSAMIQDGTIVDDDISPSAAITLTKLSSGALPTNIIVQGSNLAVGSIVNSNISTFAAISPTKLGAGTLPTNVQVTSASIVNGTIVDADINSGAAIQGTKIAAATTTSRGTVQLSTSVNDTSTTTAATPSAVKAAYDLANSMQQGFTLLNTTSSTSIAANQSISVLVSGRTITLPFLVNNGDTVKINVGNFTNTIIARNSRKIMDKNEDLIIDVPNSTVTLVYDMFQGATPSQAFGWRIV